MYNLDRLKNLSGCNPNQDSVTALENDRASLNSHYDRAIADTKAGKRLDEGMFTSIKAAIMTAGKLTSAGTAAVVSKAKALSSAVKNVYLDAKAKAELKELLKGMQKAVTNFEALEKSVPTILERDAEVKKEITLFKDLFVKTIEGLVARMSIASGIKEGVELNDMLIVEGIIAAGEVGLHGLEYAVIKTLPGLKVQRADSNTLFISGYGSDDEKSTLEEVQDLIKKHKIKAEVIFDTGAKRLVVTSTKHKPMSEAQKYTFYKISYTEFERLVSSTEDYVETEIDGRSVIAAMIEKDCIGIYYNKAKIGSSCKNFKGDILAYAENDTFWPYGN